MLESGTWTVKPQEAARADEPAERSDAPVTRFSYLPLDGETLLILTSHFGKFRADVSIGEAHQTLRGTLAFSCCEMGPAEDQAEAASPECQSARKTDPLSASKFDPPCGVEIRA